MKNEKEQWLLLQDLDRSLSLVRHIFLRTNGYIAQRCERFCGEMTMPRHCDVENSQWRIRYL